MAPALAENLALLTDAPTGMVRLRSLILDLALTGRLNGHPADAATSDLPALPGGWRYVLFNEVIDRDYPIAYGVLVPGPEVPGGIPFVRIADLSLDSPEPLPEKTISASVDAQFSRTKLRGGEILMGVVGSIGKLGIAPSSWAGANIARAVCRIAPSREVSREFVLLLLQSDFMRKQFIGDTRTLAQPTLNIGLIRTARAPLPPLAEQHGIVAKVNELMALCDRLEARQQDAEAAHARLVQALLDSLTQARDADDFQACWQQLAGAFPALFTTQGSIDALASTVLDLAVSGRLVPASSEEVPAAQLLREVASLKEKLMDTDGLRTSARDDVTAEEQYLPLPKGWSYARIGNLARFIDYRGRTPVKTMDGVPLITAKNVRPGRISRDPREFIASEEFSSWMTRGLPRVGDMLFTTEAPLGNVALIDIDERFALAQRVICFQLHRLDMGPYLQLAFMSRLVQKQILDMATGMTATGVKASRLKELPLPIPPLGEQHRIVAKATELLAFCDQLKARIAAARAKQAQLTEALVAQAVAA